jgi:hypothetical protein
MFLFLTLATFFSELPPPPVIELRDGTVVNEVVGPYHEGESIDLKCSINNGKRQ